MRIYQLISAHNSCPNSEGLLSSRLALALLLLLLLQLFVVTVVSTNEEAACFE